MKVNFFTEFPSFSMVEPWQTFTNQVGDIYMSFPHQNMVLFSMVALLAHLSNHSIFSLGECWSDLHLLSTLLILI